ncbi:hypothetical protein HYS48_02405 [Candidatus Woesearchaeota archaeon]|nr:hypothetical protein [Candidatus Woesearchaeota archaeon]
MRKVWILVLCLLFLSPALAIDERVRRDELEIDAVHCGQYGLLLRNAWNDCFVRITAKEELRYAWMSFRIMESGFHFQSSPFSVLRRGNWERADREDFDATRTEFVPFFLSQKHPQGDFLLEVRLSSGSIRPPARLRGLPLFSKVKYVPISIR